MLIEYKVNKSSTVRSFITTMAAHVNYDNAGRLSMANATPFLWKLSKSQKQSMTNWNFPTQVRPGQTIIAWIEFGGPTSSAEVSYQVQWMKQTFN